MQRFFTDGYFHRHFTEFARSLSPLGITSMSVTHMGKKMIPLVPTGVDEWLKRSYGWLLIAECTLPQPSDGAAARS